jgi:hypothetical protein
MDRLRQLLRHQAMSAMKRISVHQVRAILQFQIPKGPKKVEKKT